MGGIGRSDPVWTREGVAQQARVMRAEGGVGLETGPYLPVAFGEEHDPVGREINARHWVRPIIDGEIGEDDATASRGRDEITRVVEVHGPYFVRLSRVRIATVLPPDSIEEPILVGFQTPDATTKVG